MSAKIINTRRYKTITKSQLEKKRKQNNSSSRSSKKTRKSLKLPSFDASSFVSNVRIRKHRERKLEREMLLYSRPERTVLKEPKQKIYIPKSFIIACIVVVAILIVYISAKIMRIDEKISVAVFNGNNEQPTEKEVLLENNYDLKVALTSLGSRELSNSKNLIVNDIYKASNLKLIESKDNYTINYIVARKIEKLSDREYIITLNNSYKLDIDDVIYSVNRIMESTDSMYYERINNIMEISADGEDKYNIRVLLKEANPYFVYDLDFPLLDNESKIFGRFTYSINNGDVIFSKNEKNERKNLNTITLKEYNTIDDCVDAFRKNEVDMFFASSNNEMQLIGKSDYNVKKYKDGETLFLLGNKESDIFSRKEIRTALMYSLNRDEIVKSSDNNFIEIIDLPFLYSSIKYKYDVVGAQNLMNSYSWNKNAYGFYEKEDNGYKSATLRLLVNAEDQNKVNVANSIKTMAQNAGINIDVQALSQAEVQARVEAKDYDIVLATIYLNETPNIDFLRDYLDINETTAQAFKQVQESTVEDLSSNVQNLEYVLSDEVACIGIYARNINLVYQKYIYGFENLNYMSIFSNLDKIGKILD